MDLGQAVEAWWTTPIVGAPEVYGTLSEEGGSILLKTVDRLDPPADGGVGKPRPTLPVVHGLDRSGMPVTLLGCTRSRWGFGGSPRNPEVWTVSAVVGGRFLESADDPMTEVRFQFGPLLSWASEWVGITSHDPSESTITMTSTVEPLGDGVDGDVRIEMIAGHVWSASATSGSIERTAEVRVHPGAVALSVRRAVETYGFPIRDLLAMCTRSYVSIDQVVCYPERESSHRSPGVYCARLLRPMELPKTVQPHEMVATLPQFGMTLADLLPAWMKVWRRHREAIVYLTLPTYAPYMYTNTLALTAWLAVENYHSSAMRMSRAATKAARVAHAARVDAIVAAAPAEHQEWAERMLRPMNALGLRGKLSQLVERSGATGAAVVGANGRFVADATRVRNKTAHPSSFEDDDGPMFRYIAETLRWMLTHCLLVDVGLQSRRAEELIANQRQFQFDIQARP